MVKEAKSFTYEVDPGDFFKDAIKKALQEVDDLTIPFTMITKEWYQGNKAVFSVMSAGKWPDYKTNSKGVSGYKIWKIKKQGSAYPMLVGATTPKHQGGQLRDSLTDPGNKNTISQIINQKSLVLGTRVPYGIYHQSTAPRTKMPFRPFMFIGGEQQAPDSLQTRRDIWVQQILFFVGQKVGKVGTFKA